MSGPPDSSAGTSLALPKTFTSINEIRNFTPEKLRKAPLVNVIGFICDFQVPMETKGTTAKCTLEVKDCSIQYESYGLKVVIFWPMGQMPQNLGTKDAVVLRLFKCQSYREQPQLISNNNSVMFVLPRSHIPRSVNGCEKAPWKPFSRTSSSKGAGMKVTLDEAVYAVKANLALDHAAMPSTEEFEAKVNHSLVVRDKFSLLKDVEMDKFYDIICQVIRVYDASGVVTMYVTDYTANSKFYDNSWDTLKKLDDGDSDQSTSNANKAKDSREWPGPYGKLSIQLTLWGEDAFFAKAFLKPEQWVLLRNVRIKMSKMGGCIEGTMHEDRNVNIEPLEQAADSNDNDPRWKDAVRRKKEYFKKEKDALLKGNRKRKYSHETPNDDKQNSKERRKALRAAALANAELIEIKEAKKLDLNAHIKCNYPDIPVSGLKQILMPQKHMLGPGQEIDVPFVNAKYRSNVRVVGYFPHKVEDFTVERRVTDYDMLSDYSDSDNSDSGDVRSSAIEAHEGVWEWRFALEVEDAGTEVTKERIWLVVDNLTAQGLLDMDAVNLRANKPALDELKEKLCILWGELEEQKKALIRQVNALVDVTPTSSIESPSSTASTYAPTGGQPDLDSDLEDNATIVQAAKSRLAATKRLATTGLTVNGQMVVEDPYHPVVRNKGFTCCIRQYGIKVDEEDPSKANAGKGKNGQGKTWVRTFGMFGVTIC